MRSSPTRCRDASRTSPALASRKGGGCRFQGSTKIGNRPLLPRFRLPPGPLCRPGAKSRRAPGPPPAAAGRVPASQVRRIASSLRPATSRLASTSPRSPAGKPLTPRVSRSLASCARSGGSSRRPAGATRRDAAELNGSRRRVEMQASQRYAIGLSRRAAFPAGTAAGYEQQKAPGTSPYYAPGQ